jgi:hypothetical protein
MTLAEYFSKVFAGTRRGTLPNAITVHDAATSMAGTVLATGSALPNTAYPKKMLGMRALFADGHRLFGFQIGHSLFLYMTGLTSQSFGN